MDLSRIRKVLYLLRVVKIYYCCQIKKKLSSSFIKIGYGTSDEMMCRLVMVEIC